MTTSAIVIAGARSGVGKTTITTGIMGALYRRGHKVQPFKCGPDYIDPSYHKMACGEASRNLDTWLLSHDTVLECFGRASINSDIAVVEGVMGLYDGHANLTEEGSTAEVAKLLNAPVILIVDAAKVARSIAAEVLGYQQFDRDVNIAGVIINGIGSPRHLEFCKPPIEEATGLPVIGYMPRRDDLRAPERHLGLVPVVEGPVADEWLDKLVAQIEETIDLDKLLEMATQANTPTVSPTVYPSQPVAKKTKIAVAMDKAFNFYYQDSLDLLEAWGAEIVPFSPLNDSRLPEGVSGVYLGGGFPEIFAAELAQNQDMLQSIREAGNSKIPTYAECGGLMYLGTSLTDFEGVRHEMVGLLPVESSMEKSRLTLGYREIKALANGPLLSEGQTIRGHEFHWSISDVEDFSDGGHSHASAAYEVISQDGRLEGIRQGSVWASYIHLHLAGAHGTAQRWVEMCANAVRTLS